MASSEIQTTEKTMISPGCYVKKRKDMNKIYECIESNESECVIKSSPFTPKPETSITTIATNDLIPQTMLYYHTDCLKHDILPRYKDPTHPFGGHPERSERISH